MAKYRIVKETINWSDVNVFFIEKKFLFFWELAYGRGFPTFKDAEDKLHEIIHKNVNRSKSKVIIKEYQI